MNGTGEKLFLHSCNLEIFYSLALSAVKKCKVWTFGPYEIPVWKYLGNLWPLAPNHTLLNQLYFRLESFGYKTIIRSPYLFNIGLHEYSTSKWRQIFLCYIVWLGKCRALSPSPIISAYVLELILFDAHSYTNEIEGSHTSTRRSFLNDIK